MIVLVLLRFRAPRASGRVRPMAMAIVEVTTMNAAGILGIPVVVSELKYEMEELTESTTNQATTALTSGPTRWGARA